MSADLTPYPAMKDSGVAWLGAVPEHWTTERLKSSMNNIVEPKPPNGEAPISTSL